MKYALITTLIGLILCVGIVPQIVLAQDSIEYQLLAPIPQLTTERGNPDAATSTAKTYIEGMFMLMIAVAGGLATLKIIFAGIKYMSTDAFSGKEEAKKDIEDALWGLGLAIGAWLILNTINPKLVEFNLEIPGLRVGPAFDTNLGSIDHGDVAAAQEALGCDECAAVIPLVIDGKLEWPFPTKPPGDACEGEVCYIDSGMLTKLKELTAELQKGNKISWQVTEMLPPTDNHSHKCQQLKTLVTGKCVDASLIDIFCRNQETCGRTNLSMDASFIKRFIDASYEVGLKVIYEVPNDKRKSALIGAGVPSESIITVPVRTLCATCHPTGISEHFSVYLNESVYRTR